ncbi:MAG TPA: hypothetical protein VF173_31435 [Thermoanaerobaculia bacterium]|nr:hypothetical protein [Thermoanaerobaculia bacterium]
MATSAKEAAALATLGAANFFEVSHAKSTLSYEVSNSAGQPVLTYNDGKQTKTFTGNEVSRENTALGTLVTVILKPSIDSSRQLLTLVQPEVLVNGGPEKVSLPVIFHTTAGVIPLKPGPRQTYDVQIFKGIAVLKP